MTFAADSPAMGSSFPANVNTFTCRNIVTYMIPTHDMAFTHFSLSRSSSYIGNPENSKWIQIQSLRTSNKQLQFLQSEWSSLACCDSWIYARATSCLSFIWKVLVDFGSREHSPILWHVWIYPDRCQNFFRVQSKPLLSQHSHPHASSECHESAVKHDCDYAWS